MYQLVETIKILDGEIFNLKYHQKRLDDSFEKLYKIKSTFILQDIIKIPHKFTKGLIKLRFLYSNKKYKLDFINYKARNIKTLKVVTDNEINYPIKFTNRSQINKLFEQKNDCDDILIVKNNIIIDTSSANIIFFDGNNWITPATPLLKGTCRERLLETGKINEKKIEINDLINFQSFCLINALVDENLNQIQIENIFM